MLLNLKMLFGLYDRVMLLDVRKYFVLTLVLFFSVSPLNAKKNR